MSNKIPVDVFKKELLELLNETFENTQGIYLDRGTSLLDTLGALSFEQASMPIGTKGATIAGHAEHMRFYLGVLTDYILRKPEVPIDWQCSWQLKAVDKDGWIATQQRLREAYQRTIAVITELQVWEGEDDIGASLAILAHTASHLGAIRQAIVSAEM